MASIHGILILLNPPLATREVIVIRAVETPTMRMMISHVFAS
jgi:hypothetical protein